MTDSESSSDSDLEKNHFLSFKKKKEKKMAVSERLWAGAQIIAGSSTFHRSIKVL